MKKIFGLRKIKTAIAIALCLFIYVLLKLVEYIPGCPEDLAYTWYNPFFAGIATAYSIHASKSASLKQAKNRCVASLIGGTIGILIIVIYELFGGVWPGTNTVDLSSFNFVIPYLLVPIAVILVIYVGILLKQEQAIFVAILTLLSITVGPNTNVPNWQWQFGINRIGSTIVGVLIALGVNSFRIPRFRKNDNLLFCIGIEGILNNNSETFQGFIKYKLNNLYQLNINVSLFTTRTPTTFMYLLNDVSVNRPVVCMSGAALYDPVKLTYLDTETIDDLVSKRLKESLMKMNISPFVNVIEHDVLYTYIEDINNEGERIYAESKKNERYTNFIIGNTPVNDVLYFLLVEPEDVINNVIKLIEKEFKDDLFIQVYDMLDNSVEGLKYLKIYSKKVEELRVLHNYCDKFNLDIVGLTATKYTNHLLDNSDISITISSADDAVKEKCSKVVKSDSYDDLFKEVHRIYHANLNESGNKA